MNVRVVDYRAADAAEQFTRSLHETGFGVLVNHPIDQQLVEKSTPTGWPSSSPQKHDYAFSVEKQDGYFSPAISETAKGASLKDIKEYFHIYPWGRVPPQLADDARRYYASANALARELLGWVEQYTPADIAAHYSEPLSGMIADSQQTLLRVLRYPPLSGEEPRCIACRCAWRHQSADHPACCHDPACKCRTWTATGWMCRVTSAC
jgi:isopenicillin N synthase-like dioxygenase